jgi:hypothetical protein
MQVEGQQDISVLLATGERVRNTYAIYLVLGHSSRKRELIPHILTTAHADMRKAPAVRDEHASH